MRLDLFVKLKYESSTIILFDGIRYSVRDLLSDFLFPYFLIFWFLDMILSDALILPISQLQT